MKDKQEIANKVVRKMLKRGVLGGHKESIDTVVSRSGIASHNEGKAKDVVEDLIQDGPLEGYGGGGRQNVRLQSVEAAVDYLEDNDGDVPFGFKN